MPRPGVTVNIVDEVYPGAAALDTGQAFMVGKSDRGSVTEAVKIQSLKDYITRYGPRAGGSSLYDGVSSFFDEGGSTVYVARAAGVGALKASVVYGTQMKAEAASPGLWGNNLKVSTVVPPAGATGVVVEIRDGTTLVDKSPPVSTPAELVSWSTGRPYVVFSITGASPVLPVTGGAQLNLAAGADGTAPGDTEYIAALALFPFALGPGQVAMPGMTTPAKLIAMCQHCDANFRCCLLDLPDSADPAVLGGAVDDLYTERGSRYGLALGSWLNYPYTGGSVIVIPYSGVQAGMIARADRMGDPSISAAGVNGISRRAIGLTQAISDANRDNLNELGVTLGKMVQGQVRTYGYRAAAGPNEDNWKFFQEARVVMAIAHRCNAAMEEYVFGTIDGKGHLFAKIHGALMGICAEFYLANALYGEQPEDAFLVDVAGQNTVTTTANGEIHASVKLKTSKTAEWIEINLVKTPLERTF
jgi:hypothetical protein